MTQQSMIFPPYISKERRHRPVDFNYFNYNHDANLRYRLSEYSPLLAFRIQGSIDPDESHSVYLRLYSFLFILTLLLSIVGIVLYFSLTPSIHRIHDIDDALPPIIFVPDLFCSKLELRVLAANDTTLDQASLYPSPLDDCPAFLTQWHSIYNSTLLFQHPACLTHALSMVYSTELGWHDRHRVEVRVSNSYDLKMSLHYADQIIITSPNAKISDLDKMLTALAINASEKVPASAFLRDKTAETTDCTGENCLDTSPSPCHYESLFKFLHSLGYRSSHNLHVLPYDWRRSSVSLLSPSLPVLSYWSTLAEALHRKHRHPVLLISHGAGTDHAVAFLRKQSDHWKDEHIEGLIALSGDLAGNIEYIPAITSGSLIRATMFSHISPSLMRPFYQTIEYFAWKLPVPHIFGDDSVVLKTDARSFTVSHLDMVDMLNTVGATGLAELYETTVSVIQDYGSDQLHSRKPLANGTVPPSLLTLMTLSEPFTPPFVNVMCLFSSDIPSISYFYLPKLDLTFQPEAVFVTSHAEDSSVDSLFTHSRSSKSAESPGSDGSGRMTNNLAFESICTLWYGFIFFALNIVCIKPSGAESFYSLHIYFA